MNLDIHSLLSKSKAFGDSRKNSWEVEKEFCYLYSWELLWITWYDLAFKRENVDRRENIDLKDDPFEVEAFGTIEHMKIWIREKAETSQDHVTCVYNPNVCHNRD